MKVWNNKTSILLNLYSVSCFLDFYFFILGLSKKPKKHVLMLSAFPLDFALCSMFLSLPNAYISICNIHFLLGYFSSWDFSICNVHISHHGLEFYFCQILVGLLDVLLYIAFVVYSSYYEIRSFHYVRILLDFFIIYTLWTSNDNVKDFVNPCFLSFHLYRDSSVPFFLIRE